MAGPAPTGPATTATTGRAGMDNPFAPELLIDTDGAVRIVTLNRPEVLNAANEALHDALIAVWRHLAADAGARAVVLSAAGRAFSAGGDFVQFVELCDDTELRRKQIEGARLLLTTVAGFQP